MSSICADQLCPRLRVPMRGDGGRLRGLSLEYSCAHHVTWSPNKLWSFRDLPPYLIYEFSDTRDTAFFRFFLMDRLNMSIGIPYIYCQSSLVLPFFTNCSRSNSWAVMSFTEINVIRAKYWTDFFYRSFSLKKGCVVDPDSRRGFSLDQKQ